MKHRGLYLFGIMCVLFNTITEIGKTLDKGSSTGNWVWIGTEIIISICLVSGAIKIWKTPVNKDDSKSECE